MDYFHYQDKQLFCEEVPLAEIAAQFGTPVYVYSRRTLERHWRAFDQALAGHKHKICFAVKANSNLAVLNVLARLGSGFDIVSGGELARVLAAGGDPAKVVFSGVGKQDWEINAALDATIACFNIESAYELKQIQRLAAAKQVKAPISIRINPDVDPQTHPYISTGLKENKFGVAIEQALVLYREAKQAPNIEIAGIDCHIGSQLTELTPFLDALAALLRLVDTLAEEGIQLKHIDMGGGLGVPYQGEHPPQPAEQAHALIQALNGRDIEIILEPGRAIAANAGVLLTQVINLKQTDDKHFAVVDCAMNDLLRPALYQAWQEIWPVTKHDQVAKAVYDVVGPVCETADFLGKGRTLAVSLHDLLAVRSSGAYGFVMSSNYNSRPRAAEVMVDGDQVHLIRQREKIEQLFELEACLPREAAHG